MAIPDPSKAGSPFCVLQTDGWNPKTPEIDNFFIPEIALRGGYYSLLLGQGGTSNLISTPRYAVYCISQR